MNRYQLIGRLTRDAELKYTNSGLAVCNFSVADNYKKKVGDNYEDAVSYFDITIFGKKAESLNQYLLKGSQVAIFGELQQDRYEKDGQKRSKVKLVFRDLQFLGGGTAKPLPDSPVKGKIETFADYNDDIEF